MSSNGHESGYQTGRKDTCIVIHPEIVSKPSNRSHEAQVEEICSLTKAIALEILEVKSLKLSRLQPGHFLGKGQRENIELLVQQHEPDLIVFNHTLSPVQQRNLERTWNVKVIDRTGLILEIFGERAQTKEGRLQVELAALDYQRSRLVRSWTHLERQRGGAGFMGGPGETQIEIDRRLISDRIVKLKKELEDVRRTRELGRKARERVPFPVVALVGYTNAGKSTLFNHLTGADIFAKDLLFATLDPTMRRIDLPSGQKAILSDTVGFISDLPTHLVAAFRATLEQVLYADVILHVIDVSQADYEAQKQDVIEILEDLGIEYESDERILEVYNKIDAIDTALAEEIERLSKVSDDILPVSAIKGAGVDDLLSKIASVLAQKHAVFCYEIPHEDGKALSWLYSHGEMVEREDGESAISLTIRLDEAAQGRFEDRFGYESRQDKV